MGKIYYGVCECGEDYIETQRKRCSEHDNPTKDPHKLYFYLENFMPHL